MSITIESLWKCFPPLCSSLVIYPLVYVQPVHHFSRAVDLIQALGSKVPQYTYLLC